MDILFLFLFFFTGVALTMGAAIMMTDPFFLMIKRIKILINQFKAARPEQQLKTEVEKGWKCANCGSYHNVEDTAVKCCNSTIIPFFVCPKCNSKWKLKTEAASCCNAGRL